MTGEKASSCGAGKLAASSVPTRRISSRRSRRSAAPIWSRIPRALFVQNRFTVESGKALRAGFRFENFLGQLHYMRERGRLFVPVDRSRKIPMVASHDVARRAFELLVRPGPRGRAFQGAFGPEDLSFTQVGSSLTAGLARTIRVTRVPRFVVRHRMLKIGRDPRPTDAFMYAFDAISRGKVTADPPRDASSTTPLSMAQWARDVVKPLLEGADADACPMRVQYEAS